MPTRYLKPGICDSDRIEKCDPMAETLWYRLLVNVDDYGRLDARPAVVKARCFPLKDTMTNDEVEALLRTLAYANLIQLYTDVRGCRYLQFNLWDNVPRSKESKFPPFDETCIQLYTDVQQLHTNLPVTVTETITETKTVNRKQAAEYSAEFESAWDEYPSRPGASKKDAYKAWCARLKAGESVEVIADGVRRYAAYCAVTKTDPQYIKQAVTFFGPGEHYKANWNQPNKKQASPDNFDTKDYGQGVRAL